MKPTKRCGCVASADLLALPGWLLSSRPPPFFFFVFCLLSSVSCLQKSDGHDDKVAECDCCKLWVHHACDKGVGLVLEHPEVLFVDCLIVDRLS